MSCKKKSDAEKIDEIKIILDNRFAVECEDDRDWMEHYESTLQRIEDIIDGN